MAENAVGEEGDSPSSTEFNDDDNDKTEPEPIKLLCLLRFSRLLVFLFSCPTEVDLTRSKIVSSYHLV